MLSQRGPVVIDWRNATNGPPDLDLALSAVILAQVAVDETQDMVAAARALLTDFLRYAGGHPLSMMDHAVAMRSADPAMTAEEVARIPAAAALVRASCLPFT